MCALDKRVELETSASFLFTVSVAFNSELSDYQQFRQLFLPTSPYTLVLKLKKRIQVLPHVFFPAGFARRFVASSLQNKQTFNIIL